MISRYRIVFLFFFNLFLILYYFSPKIKRIIFFLLKKNGSKYQIDYFHFHLFSYFFTKYRFVPYNFPISEDLSLRLKKGSVTSDCLSSPHGCCPDGVTTSQNSNNSNCIDSSEHKKCDDSEFGCCSDQVSTASGPFNEGCIDHSCEVIYIVF